MALSSQLFPETVLLIPVNFSENFFFANKTGITGSEKHSYGEEQYLSVKFKNLN
jgi:hypothetical protein